MTRQTGLRRRARRRSMGGLRYGGTLLCVGFLSALWLSSGSASAQDDRRGMAGEVCFPNGTCHEGLSCIASTCVPAPSPTPREPVKSAAPAGTSSTDAPSAPSASSAPPARRVTAPERAAPRVAAPERPASRVASPPRAPRAKASPPISSRKTNNGPSPWIGGGLELSGTFCGTVLCGLPALGAAIVTPLGVGGLIGLALIPLGAVVGASVGGGIAELWHDGDLSVLRILAPAGVAGGVGLAGGLAVVGAGFFVGNTAENAAVGAGGALAALLPVACLLGIAAAGTYAGMAFLAAPPPERRRAQAGELPPEPPAFAWSQAGGGQIAF